MISTRRLLVYMKLMITDIVRKMVHIVHLVTAPMIYDRRFLMHHVAPSLDPTCRKNCL